MRNLQQEKQKLELQVQALLSQNLNLATEYSKKTNSEFEDFRELYRHGKRQQNKRRVIAQQGHVY